MKRKIARPFLVAVKIRPKNIVYAFTTKRAMMSFVKDLKKWNLKLDKAIPKIQFAFVKVDPNA